MPVPPSAGTRTFHSFFSAYLLGMIVSKNKGVSHATKDNTTYNPAPRYVHFMSQETKPSVEGGWREPL